MSQPRAHMLDIPYRHAGMRHAGEDGAMVEFSGAAYTVHHNYLVPHYHREAKQDANHRREALVAKRVKRFFYTAEPGIDIPMTRAQLARTMDEYEACPVAELHKIKGRLLAGAMMNRMGRLAEAILHRSVEHAGIELLPDQPPYGLSDAQIAECKKEFITYYQYLVADGRHDPIRYVRMRDYSLDRDGVLADLVRETGKPISMPEDMLQNDILRKIGFTMDAIDEVHAQTQRIMGDRTMQRALDHACSAVIGTVYGDNDLPETTRGATRYKQIVHELTDLCRARAGIPAEDIESFLAVRERIDYLDGILFKVNKELKHIASMPGFETVDRGQHLLWDGLNLIREMSNSRLPHNHHSLDVYENEVNPKRDNSSAGRFKDMIDAWQAPVARGR